MIVMIKSPLTGSNSDILFEYSVEKVLDIYTKETNVDVSRFFQGQDSFKLCKCPDTGFQFYFPHSIFGDGKFYEELHHNNQHYYPEWKWENQQAMELMKNRFTDKVKLDLLEVGCGEGFFLKAVRKEFPLIDLCGLELNESVVEMLNRKNYLSYHQSIEEHANQYYQKYDMVIAFQVLEHVPDVHSFINACIKALKPGGVLLFGVPNNSSYIFRNDPYHVLNLPPHHMGLWDELSLRGLANIFPLKIVNIVSEPPDMKNLGLFFRVWLKKHLNALREIIYPLFRIPVKMLLRIFRPKYGHTIVAIYEKA
jgi:SAM-dependent methyltransferase